MELIDPLDCRKSLRTADIASQSWKNHGEVVVVQNLDDAFLLADEYASEHVQILTERPREALTKMQHYGALFLGKNTCVSYGDKCIGTNQCVRVQPATRSTYLTDFDGLFSAFFPRERLHDTLVACGSVNS